VEQAGALGLAARAARQAPSPHRSLVGVDDADLQVGRHLAGALGDLRLGESVTKTTPRRAARRLTAFAATLS
jgi:hypothetical protein